MPRNLPPLPSPDLLHALAAMGHSVPGALERQAFAIVATGDTRTDASILLKTPSRSGATRISKTFGDTQVIRGVDIAIGDGEFAVFVGPSGCGKSTLLQQPLQALVHDRPQVRPGDTQRLAAAPEQVHVFDAVTQQRVD